VVERRISIGSDDAEERAGRGSVSLTGSDLELAVDGTKVQWVGMRFPNLLIPTGASIQNAWIQLTADEIKVGPAALTIQGEASANPGTFTSTGFNVSSRPRTSASVPWAPDPWNALEESGPAEKTPSLTAIVQEIVNQPGWNAGNAMVFIVSGSGTRTAEPIEGGATRAPLLHIEYGP